MTSPRAASAPSPPMSTPLNGTATDPGGVDFAALERIQIVACGTAYIAGHDRPLPDRAAGRPAGGRRDRLGVPLSPAGPAARMPWPSPCRQSGETADTLAALRLLPGQGMKTAAVVNATEFDHGPRGRCRLADPLRTRDRRRLDQGLHRPGQRADRPRRRRRPRARPDRRGRGAAAGPRS